MPEVSLFTDIELCKSIYTSSFGNRRGRLKQGDAVHAVDECNISLWHPESLRLPASQTSLPTKVVRVNASVTSKPGPNHSARQLTSGLQPPTSNLRPTTPSLQPPTPGHQPPTSSFQPPTCSPQPAACSLQPPASNPQPSNHQPPVTHPGPLQDIGLSNLCPAV